MAIERMSVIPCMITWARQKSGYDIEEPKQYFPKIEYWESGELGPTYNQFKMLGKRFSICKAAFFLPERPDIDVFRLSYPLKKYIF